MKDWKNFAGRCSRGQYWRRTAVCAAAAPALVGAAVVIAGAGPAALALAPVALLLLVVTAMAAATVRRLHDRNVSGWWLGILLALGFLNLVINVGGIAGGFGMVIALAALGLAGTLLVQALLPGTANANDFGPAPRATGSLRRRAPCPASGASRGRTEQRGPQLSEEIGFVGVRVRPGLSTAPAGMGAEIDDHREALRPHATAARTGSDDGKLSHEGEAPRRRARPDAGRPAGPAGAGRCPTR